jgi:hypothetical protein
MFTMPDPSDPPDYALPLREAFGLAGIRDIRFIKMTNEALPMSFSIFVGPAPLNAEGDGQFALTIGRVIRRRAAHLS